jgi:hypothetical protein
MAEFGLIIPQGIGHVRSKVPDLIEDATNDLPGTFRVLVDQLLAHLKWLDTQIDCWRSPKTDPLRAIVFTQN